MWWSPIKFSNYQQLFENIGLVPWEPSFSEGLPIFPASFPSFLLVFKAKTRSRCRAPRMLRNLIRFGRSQTSSHSWRQSVLAFLSQSREFSFASWLSCFHLPALFGLFGLLPAGSLTCCRFLFLERNCSTCSALIKLLQKKKEAIVNRDSTRIMAIWLYVYISRSHGVSAWVDLPSGNPIPNWLFRTTQCGLKETSAAVFGRKSPQVGRLEIV